MKRPLFASCAIAVAAFACGSNVIPASGLMVVITSDGALGSDFDAIKIQVNGRDVDTSTVTLPTTLGITGAPGSRVLFEARGQKNNVLHVAVLNETTIPSGRVARLDVKLARDCYDRCVQFGPTDTLGDVCDPDTLGSAPSTKTCGPPRPIAVDSLPTYDPSRDPVSNPSAAPPSGCAAPSAYCTSTLGCNDVVGTDKSAGALVCDAACSRVEQTTTCHDASLDPGSVWSTFGGQMSRTQVSRIDGPKTAPETITTAATNFSGAMTISADNTRAFLPLGVFANGATHVAAIDLSTLTPTALLDPSPADLLAALGSGNLANSVTAKAMVGAGLYANGASSLRCCANAASLTLSALGTLFGVSSWGVLFGYTDVSKPPTILWLERDYLPLILGHGIAICGADCSFGGVALSGDGKTAYVGTRVGLVAVDLSHTPWINKWGPLTPCASGASTPAVGADGRIYIGRLDGGICVATPDGRSQTYEADDGVLGSVDGSPAIGVDATVYFGTSTGNFYARGPRTAWSVFLGGPISSGAAIGADGTLYVESGNPNLALHAIDRSGRLKWTKPLRGDLGATTSPTIDHGGTIYAGDPGGFLHALRSNGTEVWQLGLGSLVASPLVITADGLLGLRGSRFVHLTVGP